MGKARLKDDSVSTKKSLSKILKSKLLSLQRLVYDALKCYKKNGHDIEITAKMITLCIAACSRYVIAPKEAKKLRENEAANNKRKIIAD